jgi:RHS repeat-associated protein
MPTNRETLLCRYHYDPLDRLADCKPSAQASTQRFYLKDHLATEIQGTVQRSILQHEDQLLAQQQRQSGTVETTLLATDQQRSVLNALDTTQPHPLAYTPYGHRTPGGGLLSLLGFNGERPDPVTGHYLLGNGYRAFNPVLMRFNSPDSWSPFGEGGLNAYAYCVGDPVNREDPTGHSIRSIFQTLRRSFSSRLPSRAALKSEDTVSLLSSAKNSGSIQALATPEIPSTQSILTNAKIATENSSSMNYTGKKLQSLERAKNKLSKYQTDKPKKIEKYYRNRESADGYGLSDDSFLYKQATSDFNIKLENLKQATIKKTEFLNHKLDRLRHQLATQSAPAIRADS